MIPTGSSGYFSTGESRCPCCGYSMSNCYTISTISNRRIDKDYVEDPHEHLAEQDVADAPFPPVRSVRPLRRAWPQARAPPSTRSRRCVERLGKGAMMMTKREARKWVRQHWATYMDSADLPDGAPYEVFMVWSDESERLARKLGLHRDFDRLPPTG